MSRYLVQAALDQAVKIRKCEQRPAGHFDVGAENCKLGDDLYQMVVCGDCGRGKPFGNPLPLPAGERCQHCVSLPDPMCGDECHAEHDIWNIEPSPTEWHCIHGTRVNIQGDGCAECRAARERARR